MSLLSTAKKILIQETFEFYETVFEDIPLEKIYFIDHFRNLADALWEIESIKTLSDLVRKLEEGCFENLYYFPGEGDEDRLKTFFQKLTESI